MESKDKQIEKARKSMQEFEMAWQEYFKDAIKLLEGDSPKKTCGWCERV